jgi:hypothetical protein
MRYQLGLLDFLRNFDKIFIHRTDQFPSRSHNIYEFYADNDFFLLNQLCKPFSPLYEHCTSKQLTVTSVTQSGPQIDSSQLAADEILYVPLLQRLS